MTTLLRRRIPSPLKQVAKNYIGVIPPGFRLGRHYKTTQRFLRLAEWWNAETINAWQLQRLRHIITYAYENVSGYYALYNAARITPESIRSLDDVKNLPFVTKELMRDNLSDFTSRAIPKCETGLCLDRGLHWRSFRLFPNSSKYATRRRFYASRLERAGWRLGEISAELRGGFVGSEEKFWKYDNYERTLFLSSYYLTDNTYDRYVNKVLKYKPRYLKAYPSAATVLADLVLSRKQVEQISFEILLLGSENLYDWQRAKLASAFPSAKLFAWYGHAEQVILAAMCEGSDQYHIWPFYGLTELCNNEGKEVDPGENGELVGTSFWNNATPFIRYRTQDFALKGDSNCRKCHRQFQLLSHVDGRLQEMIISRTGRYISMTAINMHSNVFEHVKQFQFHQVTPGKVKFLIIRKSGYSDQDTRRISHDLSEKLGSDIDLEIIFTDAIPKPSNGKFRFLRQELQLNYGE